MHKRRPLVERAGGHPGGSDLVSANLTPFERGNGAAVKHGAYARLRLSPRADQLAEELAELVPSYAASDEPAIAVLSMALAQLEIANVVLSEATARRVKRLGEGKRETKGERDELRRLTADTRGWVNSCRRLLGDLGLTPTLSEICNDERPGGTQLRLSSPPRQTSVEAHGWRLRETRKPKQALSQTVSCRESPGDRGSTFPTSLVGGHSTKARAERVSMCGRRPSGCGVAPPARARRGSEPSHT